MKMINSTPSPATAIRPVAKSPESPVPTREQKLQLASDRFHATVRRAQDRLEDGFGQGVKCSGVAGRAGMTVARAVGSLAGAGGADDAPAVLGELVGVLVTAPACYAGAVANSFLQQGVMLAAEGKYKLEEMKNGH